MGRRPNISRQTRLVLAALASAPSQWWHGYDLVKQLGLKSGTLYPLLMRLHEQGLLEAEWRATEGRGRPPRHMYRLTAAGGALAAELDRELAASALRRGAFRPA
jgi:DNA-binding PadR family transcriptional regulator